MTSVAYWTVFAIIASVVVGYAVILLDRRYRQWKWDRIRGKQRPSTFRFPHRRHRPDWMTAQEFFKSEDVSATTGTASSE